MKSGLIYFIMGLCCSLTMAWGVGCTNRGSYELLGSASKLQAQPSQSPKPNTSPQPNPSGSVPSIAGTWDCGEESCGAGVLTISKDLSSLTHLGRLGTDSGDVSCRISQTYKLAITNAKDLDVLEGTLSGGNPSLVGDESNTADCNSLIQAADQQPLENAPVTIERDGNQVLIVNGQRYVRDLSQAHGGEKQR